MKITPAKAKGFLEKPSASVRVFLLYGENEAAIKHAQKRLIQGFSGKDSHAEVVTLEEAALAKDTGLLQMEAFSSSLFGEQRILLVTDASDKSTGAVTALLGFIGEQSSGAEAYPVIITTGSLGARSSLRAACEKSDFAASVAFYVSSANDIIQTAQALLSARGIRAHGDLLAIFAPKWQNASLSLEQDIEKMALFIGEAASPSKAYTLTAADVKLCWSADSDTGMEEVLKAFAMGDTPALCSAIHQLNWENEFIPLARSLSRFLQRLLTVFAMGMPFRETNLDSLRPPVHFTEKAAYLAALKRLSPKQCKELLAEMMILEANLKTAGQSNAIYFEKILLEPFSTKNTL